jgi:oligoendopeptidase F
MVERGEPITSESLTQLYAKLLKDYYGSALESDELTDHLWASVPHLYLGFYTYSYAVGEVSAAVLASDMLAEDRGDTSKRGAVNRYINFLKAGSSKHPDLLLKDAGVDLTTAKPIESYVLYYSQLVDELDQLTQ